MHRHPRRRLGTHHWSNILDDKHLLVWVLVWRACGEEGHVGEEHGDVVDVLCQGEQHQVVNLHPLPAESLTGQAAKPLYCRHSPLSTRRFLGISCRMDSKAHLECLSRI